MKPQVPLLKAALLFDALTSGEYVKIKGKLREGNSNCMCLEGVMCDIFHQETGEGEWRISRHKTLWTSFDGYFTFMPDFVSNWWGIDSLGNYRFMMINDNTEITFPQIAELIFDNIEIVD